ncbi:MAG: DNA double-strand break repair nuclease NurA, partial [Anaerolineae bacterium]
MTLELSQLTQEVQTMGEVVASRQHLYADLVDLARQWLADFAEEGAALRHTARSELAAVPTEQPLDAVHPLPGIPERFTVIAADGSQIQPDRHGAALYYMINVGSLIYRHGSGEAPEASSEATIGYTEDDLYENGVPVAGNLLDVRRDLAEVRRLADGCAAERSGPTAALVDGSIVLWVLKDLPGQARSTKVAAYLDQLERIRGAGSCIGGFISRPGYREIARLLYLASVDGDKKKVGEQPNPLEHLPDRAIFTHLPPGARSALFISPKEINRRYYARAGHEVHFFYLNLASEGKGPVIARVEVPAWVADDDERLNLIHGAVVAQARITGDYPYALA